MAEDNDRGALRVEIDCHTSKHIVNGHLYQLRLSSTLLIFFNFLRRHMVE